MLMKAVGSSGGRKLFNFHRKKILNFTRDLLFLLFEKYVNSIPMDPNSEHEQILTCFLSSFILKRWTSNAQVG